MTDVAVVASPIDTFWDLLHTQGCLNSGNTSLNISPTSQLGSPPITALIADAAIFPTGALQMTLTSATHAATIVLTGTLQGTFLGVTTPAAVATFTIDGSNVAQLSLAVAMGSGYTLATSFSALAGSFPGGQAFSAPTFIAASASAAPTLSFSGTPVLTSDIAGLWPKGAGALTGAVTPPTATGQLPAFTLSTPLTSAPFGFGLAPLSVQMSLTSAPGGSAAGAVLGQVSINSAWAPMPVSMPLPVPTSGATLASPTLAQAFTDLIQVAPVFAGQALANLIPVRFPIGNDFSLTAAQIWLADGSGSAQAVQVTVSFAANLTLLPADLATLTNVDVTFWAFVGGSPQVSVTFNGDFVLAKSALQLSAGFSLPSCVATVSNNAPIDVGVLVGSLVPGLSPPRGQLTIETLQATVSPIDGTYNFYGEVDFGSAWSIDLGRGVPALALDSVTFTANRTTAGLGLTFGAELEFMGSTFDLTASHEPNAGWVFSGMMLPTTPLTLENIAKQLLPSVASYVPDIQVLQLTGSFNTDNNTYAIASTLQWKLDVPGVDLVVTAAFQLQSARATKNDTPTFSGFVRGEVDINKLVLQVAYVFSPTSQDIIFKYKELTVDYHRDKTDPYVSISLANSSVGSLVEFLLSFADPGNDFKLSAPWDALEKIGLPNLTVKVHLVTKEIDVEVDIDANLGFIDITKFTLSYVRQYGKAQLNVGLYGTFLGEDFTKQPLGWDLLNDPAPAAPGSGVQTFDLEYFGLGQRLTLREPPPPTMDEVIAALENALTPTGNPQQNPATQLPGLAFDPTSNWLIGARFTVMSTVELSIVFNDPNLYGLLLQLSGEKAGIFAGLRFEILYRKISDSIGLYHIELTLPDEMRHLEFGEVSITLPILTLDIYTNGNFRVDLGFPPSLTDFSRSFSIQVFPFVGYGGFYFAVLDGQTSTQVPTIDSGQFKPVLEFGFALSVGVGKTLSLGILSGGISITVGGMLQGVLAWYHPTQSNLPTEQFYKLVGTVAIVGEVYATVDFGIISASVSLTVYVTATIDLECYKAILIEASAGVEVEVSIKILFVRIHFSFSATITERFVIGSDSTPPWHVIPGPSPQQPQIARSAYRARPALARPIPHSVLRARAARKLTARRRRLRSFVAAAANSIDVTVMPLVSQALTTDFGFPTGPTPPSGAVSPALAVLLGVPTSNDPTTGFNQLEVLLLEWAVDSIGHEHGAVSAAVLDEIADALKADDAVDTYFAYTALEQLFADNSIVFNLVPRPATDPGSLVDMAFMAMIPPVELQAPLATGTFDIKFWTDRTPVGDYESTVRGYFDKLMAQFATSPGSSSVLAQANSESLATFVFRNYFLMLARGVVQAARDAMRVASYTVSARATTTLTSIANSFNNDYTARAGDTAAGIAAMFGLTAAQVQAANPSLDFTALPAGQAVFIPALVVTYASQAGDTAASVAACFGVSVAALEAANPTVSFPPAAGTALSIPATRVAHTSLAGETGQSIATEFAVTLAQLAAANPTVTLNPLAPNTPLLIPLRVTPTAIAAANQGATGILTDGAVMPLGDIPITAASTDSLTSIATTFGVQTIALMGANQESKTLLASGQAIDLGKLGYTTRDGDSLNGVCGYWGVAVADFATANPTLALASPQALNIPLPAGDVVYHVAAGDTLTTLAAQGASVAAVAAYNTTISLTSGQAATLADVQHTTSASYFVPYSATTGDTLTSIAAAYFAPDAASQAAALQSLGQWNSGLTPTDPLTAGQIIQIPYFSSLANICRVYGVTLSQLSQNAAIGVASLLAQRAPLTVPQVSHRIVGATDSLSGIAQSYDLALEDLADRIALTPGLFAAGTLSVTALPAMQQGALTLALASSGGFTNAANMASRFMLNGLRLPAPQFAGAPAPSATTAYPLYALIGQEFPVPATLPSGYAITLTPQPSCSWLQTAGGQLVMPLTADEVQRVADFGSLSFQGAADSTIQPLPLYAYVPDQQPVRQIRPWQTPDAPDGLAVTGQKAVQLRLWSMPDALTGAIAASPSRQLPYQGAVTTRNTDGSVTTTPLTATRWAVTVDITLQQLPDPAPGAYLVMGADQDGMQRLLALWAYCQSNNHGASLYLVYPQQSSTNASGAVVSDAIDRTNSFILKTNLSTESHGEPPSVAGVQAVRLSSTTADSPIATLQPTDSTRFLELLWECSVVKSGGYYLRYATTDGQLGLPGTLFASGRQATVTLAAVLDVQSTNYPLAYAFNNVMVVGDNVDTGADTVVFEAITYTIAAGDTLQSIAAQYPVLNFNAGSLASANQTILGQLVVGASVAGQTVGPHDTFASIAARAGISVLTLGTQIAATTGILNPGALMQLGGEPLQEVQAGDTLASISSEYDFLDPAALAALNATSTTLLAVGASMTIPGQAAHPIAANESFASIAQTTGVDIAALGEANGETAILAVGAWIQVGGNPLRLTASLPPGHVGFSVVRPNPQPADPTTETAQQALDTLFNLLGFQLTANSFFTASNEGLPAGPAKASPGASDTAPWNYRQVAAVYTLASSNEGASSPALPPASADPYAGSAPGSTAPLALNFQDILGNRTLGAGLAVAPAVGYTDELVALSAWPAVSTSYRFFPPVANGSNFAMSVGVAPTRYLPSAAGGDAASKRATQDAAQYATISYQLQQDDVTCWLSTTLGAFATPDQLGPIAHASLLGVANSAYVFLGQAAGLVQTSVAVGAGASYPTFAALIDTGAATPGYPTTFADLAQANTAGRADLLFGDGTPLTLPDNAVVKAGDTSLAIADAGQITVSVLADNNADVALAPGQAVATAARTYTVPAGDPLCFQALAAAQMANAPIADAPGGVPGLATANAATVLAQDLTLVLGSDSFPTGASDTLTTAAAFFQAKQGVTVGPADVAMANRFLDGLYAGGAVLKVTSAVTQTGDTLTSLAQSVGPPPGNGSPAAQMLVGNENVPGLWTAGTALLVGTTTHVVAQGETLSTIAASSATSVAALLTDNAALALVSGGTVAMPYLADNAAIAWSTYQSAGNESFAGVVGRFAGWSLAQLGLDNQDVIGLFAPVAITLSGKTVTPAIGDTFRSLGVQFGLTPDAFANAVGAIGALVRAGGVMVAPAMAALEGETLQAAATRYATDCGGLAAASACLPGLLAAGQVTIDGTNYPVTANDAFAFLTARINAARQALSPPLPLVSIAQVGLAAAQVTLHARTLLPPPLGAVIQAAATPANAQPIQHLAVNLAISRDPAYVAPSFQNAPRVISTQTGITAAPYADAGAAEQASLTQFAQDFETAFPGLKIATGPDQVQGATVLAKPSMLGATAASSSSSGRGLWVVNFTTNGAGFTYAVDGATPRFFGVPPLSIDTWNGVNIAVPTYDGANGLLWPGKTLNFRSSDPDQWNLSFLAAVDLLLSPAYAVPAATNAALAAAVGSVLASKATIASSLSQLAAPIIGTDNTGLGDAQTALAQQLLVALSRLYQMQALVQLPVTVAGSGAGADPKTAPQLSGKLTAQVVTTPADGVGPAVDPAHPLATLATQCGVSDVYLATVIAETPQIVRPGVTVTFGGATYVTMAQDTLTTIAAQVGAADVPRLAASMTTGAASPNPFLGSTAINVTPLTAPGALTDLTDVAGWLTATIADTLQANAERTDFFTGAAVTAGATSVPLTGQSVETVAKTFGGIAQLADQLGEVDAGGLPGGYQLNPAAPPRGLQLVPQLSFTTSKAALSADGSTITTLFSIKDPGAHKSVTLNLDFGVNQLEFDIHGVAGIAGFQSSSWLSFIIPLTDTSQTSSSAGLVQIPVPLRGYPAPVVVSNQVSESGWPGDAQAIEAQWNYAFSALRQTAAQDVATVEVRFNTGGGSTSVNGSVAGDTSPYEAVIEALAAFSVVWPAIAEDLAQLPDLAAGATPLPAVANAVAALEQLTTKVQTAWQSLQLHANFVEPESVYEYALSALTQGDPPYFSALILDRIGQTGEDPPDDFIFSAPWSQGDVDALNAAQQLPTDLTTLFKNYGFPVAKPQIVVNTAGSDWSVVDDSAVQTALDTSSIPPKTYSFTAPQTYRILYAGDGATVFTVWRQYLWPALRLTPPPANPGAMRLAAPGLGSGGWLGATQAGPRLVYSLAANAAPVDQPLGLDFDFYRMNLLLRQNAWGGSYVSRNANLVQGGGVNPAFVYETPLAMFPTKLTPQFVNAEPIALPGATLLDALSQFFETLVSPQTATAPQSLRNIRVLGRYRQAADGVSDPTTAALSFDVPLLLVPLYPFNVSTDWSTTLAGDFCDQLAQGLADNAAAAGIPAPSPGQYVIDVLIYNMADSASTTPPQPLLRLENLTFPR